MLPNKKNKQKTASVEAKLTQLLSEISEDKKSSDRLVCETECTMARIRSLSDFLFIMRVKPIQTLCYYAAVVLFLLMIAALFCSEWLLAAIFLVLCLLCGFTPHNLRLGHFNHTADRMEKSYGKVINADFGKDEITLTVITPAPEEKPEGEEHQYAARRSAIDGALDITTEKIPYKEITAAYEISHSFYIFSADEKDRKSRETLICDKTQMLCGTPMELRNLLAEKCRRRFRIRTKKA
ncbi:MAG: hypothetical protein ACI4KM_01495 [Oscillospiraceae bacterium]